MRQAGWGVDRSLNGGVGRLLRQLLTLDDHLDVVFVLSPGIVVAPPHGSLVLALQAEMLAC